MSKKDTKNEHEPTEEGEKSKEQVEESKEETTGIPEKAAEAKEGEEEKEALEKKAEEEEEIVEERIYTVPLRRAWIVPRKKHSPKAVRVLRGFIARHMKAEEDSIKITNEVNEKIWSRGIQKPPRRVRIRVTKDTEGIVTVRLAEGD